MIRNYPTVCCFIDSYSTSCESSIVEPWRADRKHNCYTFMFTLILLYCIVAIIFLGEKLGFFLSSSCTTHSCPSVCLN